MGNDFSSAVRPAIVMTVLFAALLGLGYPLAMTGIGQLAFPVQANGSLVTEDNRVIGSTVVGQGFTTDRYFRSRPSAAGKGYDAMASAGSNLGPTSQALSDRITGDIATQRREGVRGALPADLVTASGSGLDPDLSPAAAMVQVPRIARVRGLTIARVRDLVAQATETSVFGDPHVNLLALNRALDRQAR